MEESGEKMNNKINEILNEIKKVIIGKDDKIARVLMALLAEGHILIEDVPGVGKTTLALAFSKALGLSCQQKFTPDACHPTLSAFPFYNKNGQFEYKEGAVSCNLFWQTKLTGLPVRRSRHYWRLWKKDK